MIARSFVFGVGLALALVACSGHLDVGDQDNPAAERIAAARAPSIVAVGTGHACAVLEDTTVACWGTNGAGQTGVNPEESLHSEEGSAYILAPTRVPGLDNVVQISSGGQSNYALRADGKVFGWGNVSWTPRKPGEVEPDRFIPREVPGVSEVVKVADGDGPACALRRDGTVLCWGMNMYLSVGASSGVKTNGFFEVLPPTQVPGITDAVDITVSDCMSCVRHRDGDVSCWGRLQLKADEYTPDSPLPVRIPGVHDVVEVAIAQTAAIALREDGTVMAWGDDPQREILGQMHGPRDPTVTSYDDGVPPAAFPGLTGIASVRAQYQTMCVLTAADGSVRCWGANDIGELGQGRTTTPVLVPTLVDGVIAAQLEVGTWNSCFIDTERRVQCWGYGSSGALGTGKVEKYAAKVGSPVLLPAPLARSTAP